MSFKAQYFPVEPGPLRMAAALSRFGTDFGQGERDQKFFQLDAERPRYLAAKRSAPPERRLVCGSDSASESARRAALEWMRTTLAIEAPAVLADSARDGGARDELDALARALQEDFCVIGAGEDFAGRAMLLDVRFPSGWRPERLAAADFSRIHGPVPGFPPTPRAGRSMVRGMVERGPFVRFVWTLSPDAQLDRHPDAPGRTSWSDAESVWLRVERQVTVPLPAARASVFLIRVYTYGWWELTAEQRGMARTALEVMPEAVRTYKGLPTVIDFDRVVARARGSWRATELGRPRAR